MRNLLVMGGTVFVGRAVVDAALERGWRVTAFNVDREAVLPSEVEHLVGDRTVPDQLAMLRCREWDAVVDTWTGSAEAVRDSAELLSGTVGHYAYVSTLLVYDWSRAARPLTESAPMRSPTPGTHTESYAARKAAAERAVGEVFGKHNSVVARPGLVLGPRERPGRLPRWLLRMDDMAASGEAILAPGRADRTIQYIDVRDLAEWLLDAVERKMTGAYNIACPPGHATMGDLLTACKSVTGSAVQPVWVDEDWLEGIGVCSWTELPIWVPEKGAGAALYDLDVSAALRVGLRPRPLVQTVTDTWRWLQDIGSERLDSAILRSDWLNAEKERRVLALWPVGI